MKKMNRYSGKTNIKILENGEVVVTCEKKYPSVEAARISINNPEIIAAMCQPMPVIIPFDLKMRA
jgi:hypothetical protein